MKKILNGVLKFRLLKKGNTRDMCVGESNLAIINSNILSI